MLAEWIRKHNPNICCLQETHLRKKEPYTDWKWRFGKKIGNRKLISDQIDFKTKAIQRDTKGHFIILKGRIDQEDINIANIYASNIGAPRYIRKILEDFKKDIDSNTLIPGDFNTPLSKMERSSKQNINRDIMSLIKALDQIYLTDICRTFYLKEMHILLKCTWNIFKDRPHNRTQNKPQQIQENWNHIKHFLRPQGAETGNQIKEKT